MAHITRTGENAGRNFLFISRIGFITAAFAGMSFAQTCTTSVTSNTGTIPFAHVEGLAEGLGDITVTCSGGTAGTVNAIIGVTLNANITNRIDGDGNLTGLTLFGPGVNVSQTPYLNSPTLVLFPGVSLPGVSPTFTISGLRVAVAPLAPTGGTPSVTAQVFGIGTSITTSTGPVAISGPTLASSVFNYGVPCTGSPAPATVDIPTLISTGTASSTLRVTEASPAAFQPKTAGADFGVRLMLNLSGYPANATVYVPDVLVGNRSSVPTNSGALGNTPSGGIYDPSAHPLLLVRVPNADATGNGGTLLFSALPGAATTYSTAFQVPLAKGAASVTYEVLDADNSSTDSAQIPVYVSVPASSCSGTPPNNLLSAALVPVSTVSLPSQTDPIPRYVTSVPSSDCLILNDCSANYFPRIQSSPSEISLVGSSQGVKQNSFITLTNGGANEYSFTVSVAYQQSAGLSTASWLSFSALSGIVGPTTGTASYTLTATADPKNLLVPGVYQATITIDAGSAGSSVIPVTFNVSPPGPTIQSVVNSANFQPGPVTANSFVSLFGLNLVPKGTNPPTVSVDGFSAPVSFAGQPSPTGPAQINILLPPQVSGFSTVGVIAQIDGINTNNFPVQLVANQPAVFNPGILNQNNSVNLSTTPGSRGDIIQIFLTGLATPLSVPVSVTIGTQTLSGSQIIYAGPVVSIPGLEQVNVQVPGSLSLTGNSVNLSVCIPGSGAQPNCSVAVPLYLH
jgi:uncharacterized protein (TIGR03437 family)